MSRARAVLVTAATTPVGRRVVGRLLDDPDVASVLAVSLERAGARSEQHGRLHWAQCDLTRPRDAHRLVHETAAGLGIDAIVHAPLHRKSTDTGREVWAQNVQTTRTLLTLAEESNGIQRFVLRSSADVYRVDRELPAVLAEDHPLDLSAETTQRTRDHIEADLTACTRVGTSRLRVTVLRCAEVLAPDTGSQLYDYLSSRLCLRSLGYDPVVNLLSTEDAARAVELALRAEATGVFNVPGRDLLPLSHLIERVGRTSVAVPGQALGVLYGLRRRLTGAEFAYHAHRTRFHFGAVLDGQRARRELGYEPLTGIDWGALSRALHGT